MTCYLNKWLIGALVWLGLGVYALIFREGNQLGIQPFPHFDKFVHLFLFLVQTWLLAKVWLQQGRCPPYLFLVMFGLFYAISSELVQHFWTLTRQGDIWDIVADMFGVIIGLQLASWRYQAISK